MFDDNVEISVINDELEIVDKVDYLRQERKLINAHKNDIKRRISLYI